MGTLLSGALGIVTDTLGGVWGYVAAGAFSAILAGAGVGWTVHRIDETALAQMKLADSRAARAAAVESAGIQKAQDNVSLKSAVAEAQAQQKIVTQTVTLTKEVPTYVSPQIDARDCISYGLVRVLDAGALGVDPAGLSLPTGKSDDACAPIDASHLAASVAANYGTARANAEQLNALENWIAAEIPASHGK